MSEDIYLDREQVIELLNELSIALEARNTKAEIFLVEGSAMSLCYSPRRLTRDLDAVFEPKSVVYQVAREIANTRGMPESWLNDGVKGFLPGDDPEANVFFESEWLSVRVASPRYLFLLKAFASRIGGDEDDLKTLWPLTGFNDVAEAITALEQVYPHVELPLCSKFLLLELFSPPVPPRQRCHQ
jgi:hypothetical protein